MASGAEASIGQAIVLLRQGMPGEAERLLGQVCASHPGNDKAWFLRGAVRQQRGDIDAAIADLETAVELEPRNGAAHFALCQLYLARGELAAAIARAERVIELDDAHGEAWLALGGLLADAGRFRRAERASRRAMDLLPDVDEPKINLANALIAQGKHDEATALCHRVRATATARPGIWHSLGLAFKALGRTDDAEQCLATAAGLDPGDARALCALGEIRAARGELTAALELYRRARERLPDDPRVHFQLGKVLLPASSERHRRLVERLQQDHLYADGDEARGIARQLASGLRAGDAGAELALVRFFDGYDPARLYPAEWWRAALGSFGDPRLAPDTALRAVYSAVFSWSLPCAEALARIAAFAGGRLASYGSGAGYWEYLLAAHFDIDIRCHDLALRHRFVPTRQTAHGEARIDSRDTIFLSWLPGEAAIDAEIESLLNQLERGGKLVLVGEPADAYGHPRTCGTHRFFRYLADHFALREALPLANYACFRDRVELLVKK